MAFYVSPLRSLSTAQLNALLPERFKTGLHAYYAGGFDADRKRYGCIPPGNIDEPGALTFFFENKAGSGAQPAFLRLGNFNHDQAEYIEVSMSDSTFEAKKVINGTQSFTPLFMPTPVTGPHVLQFIRTGGTLEVHMDNKLFLQQDALVPADGLDPLTVFYAQDPAVQAPPPFTFHEAHWTVEDVVRSVNAASYIPKKDYVFYTIIDLRVGGYVLWNGVWISNSPIRLYRQTTQIAEVQAPQSGEAVVLVKMYRDGFTFSHAAEAATASLNMAHKHFPANELYITYPMMLKEYKLVTGELYY